MTNVTGRSNDALIQDSYGPPGEDEENDEEERANLDNLRPDWIGEYVDYSYPEAIGNNFWDTRVQWGSSVKSSRTHFGLGGNIGHLSVFLCHTFSRDK